MAQLSADGHLVLDEPTSSMDLRHERDGMNLLRGLADAGATVVIAMHDLMLAADMADDCWLLEGGRLSAAGPAREVMDLERSCGRRPAHHRRLRRCLDRNRTAGPEGLRPGGTEL